MSTGVVLILILVITVIISLVILYLGDELEKEGYRGCLPQVTLMVIIITAFMVACTVVRLERITTW